MNEPSNPHDGRCPNCRRPETWNCLIVCGSCGRWVCGACRAPATRGAYHCVPCGQSGGGGYNPDPECRSNR